MQGIITFTWSHSCTVRTSSSYARVSIICDPDFHYKQHQPRYNKCVNGYANVFNLNLKYKQQHI